MVGWGDMHYMTVKECGHLQNMASGDVEKGGGCAVMRGKGKIRENL